MDKLAQLDLAHVWHPFTQMQVWQDSEPLVIADAEGNYLIDTAGRRYIDAISSLWVNVHGHKCPEIDAAVRRQLDRVAHSTLLGLANVPSIELASRLINVAPEGLTRVFYSDSGSTAVEVALKIAFQYWQHTGHPKKTKFIALTDAYHGDTIGSVSVGGIDLFHQLFHPLLFQTFHVTAPHPYRNPQTDDPQTCVNLCLDELENMLVQHEGEIAAVIVEPRVQGAAGIIVHPPGYLSGVQRLCRAHDVLLICDEVATGFGRTGTLFSCQAESVTPDLMSVAKGISGGYLPLAATLATESIFEAFSGSAERTFFHGHSYTGNPLACAAALASLDLFEKRDVLASVNKRSETLAALLKQRLSDLPNVGDIRQLGLMTGVELVADRATKTPLPAEQRTAAHVCHTARNHGVILRPLGDVVVIMPPLSITDSELETIVDALHRSLILHRS